jgi:hypothetical protein
MKGTSNLSSRRKYKNPLPAEIGLKDSRNSQSCLTVADYG